VSIAPKDVHISDEEALWPIYMEKGGFVKSQYYNIFDIDVYATVFACTDLTDNNLWSILWYLAAQPDKYDKLRAEIRYNEATDKKAFSYFSGAIKEALRSSMAISCRLPRIVPPGGFNYSGVHIPAGARGCIARNLAMLELYVVAEIMVKSDILEV
jgi:hypothetical protein